MVVLSMHGAMLRPPAMQPASIEVVVGVDKLKSPGRPTMCGMQIGGDCVSPGTDEMGRIDLSAPVPLRI
jgi:hypothetical protein